MGYLHINNLYKDQKILLFREVYALEKIHGTSAHVGLGPNSQPLKLFSGGEKYENFAKLFDHALLAERLAAIADDIIIFGEAYGGKCQGMKDTYGPDLKFVAFDVLLGRQWLEVPNAEDVCGKIGIEFVHYRRTSTDLQALDAERDADSVQAVRNGCGTGKIREGIVLRPPIEVSLKNGDRLIAKHKRPEFGETKTPRVVDPGKLAVLADAERIADEWVTEMRLNHVLDKLGNPNEMRDTGRVIAAMLEDIVREAAGEIVDSKDARTAISTKAAKMFKGRVRRIVV